MNKYFDESDVNFFKIVGATAIVVTMLAWFLI